MRQEHEMTGKDAKSHLLEAPSVSSQGEIKRIAIIAIQYYR